MKSSNSSFAIRKELKESQGAVNICTAKNFPRIDEAVCYAQQLYEAAAQNDSVGQSLSMKYIQWYHYIHFATHELPSHREYQKKKETIEKVLRPMTYQAMTKLEDVARRMDLQQDEVNRLEEYADLIDEFDGPSIASSSSQVLTAPPPPEENAWPRTSSQLAEKLSILSTPVVEAPPDHLTLLNYYPTAPHIDHNIGNSEHMEDVSGFTLPRFVIEIVRRLGNIRQFVAPNPYVSLLHITIPGHSPVTFAKDDYNVSFIPFLRQLPPDLLSIRQVVETNRCFFLHLGMATSVHPFALQLYFRYVCSLRLAKNKDTLESEILSSCMEYSQFVDANCLTFIWPEEFNNYRICLISGSITNPLFTERTSELLDLFIHNDSKHFTLLRPYLPPSSQLSVIDRLLVAAKRSGCIVQEIEVNAKCVIYPSVESFVCDINQSSRF